MTIRDEAFAGRPLSCPVIDAHTHLMNALYLVAEDYGIALFVVGGKFHR